MKDIIIDFLESDKWKIHLTIAIDFISSKDVEEERLMHSKRDNPAGNYMFKVKYSNTRTRCEICSKLTIKKPYC